LKPSETRGLIHVVAAAVTDKAGRVLIAQRPQGKHLAGGWEFPGGKLKAQEDRRAGLARELFEELGITIATPRPLMRLRHTYSYGEVLLDMWVVRHYTGEPVGLDGQALRWCTLSELQSVELLPADAPIVKALWLPERLEQVSTPDYTVGDLRLAAQGGRLRGALCAHAGQAEALARDGADFLVLREGVSRGEITEICESIPVPVYAPPVPLYAPRLSIEEAWSLGATGISELQPLDSRRKTA
jgi:8-oxo-dGTP diphosphatase